jgi:hypothetical protein
MGVAMSKSEAIDSNSALFAKRRAHAPGIDPAWYGGGTGAVVFERGSYAVGFSGRKEQPDFAGDFVTEDIRRKAVLSWLTSLERKRRARRSVRGSVE